MNREIKFRIWDKQYKVWLENSASFHCFSNWSICPFTGNLVDYVESIDGPHDDTYVASPALDYYLTANGVVKEPRYVIQQYTGLKDKNGNEIYEGDIVRKMIIGPVEYFLGEFSIGGVVPLKDFLIIPSDENQPLNFDLDLEIIGNIFENPELLKQ